MREITSAKAVVDVYYGDSWRARIQHRHQRRRSAKSGAIPNTSRHGNHRRCDQAAYNCRQDAIHSCNHNDHIRSIQCIARGEQAMNTGNADVIKSLNSAAERARGNCCLLGDGNVGSSRTDNQHIRLSRVSSVQSQLNYPSILEVSCGRKTIVDRIIDFTRGPRREYR